MTTTLRGINLGGWLVAERWMTPGLFEGVKASGERALVVELGLEAAKARILEHRETFITEKDFRWIKSHGYDVVRLPVGYWIFADDRGFISGQCYVDKAFEWARRHRLGIILDFHGLQGSQNGNDHSGQVGKVRFYRRDNVSKALRTMQLMTERYGREPALVAIEIINEPNARFRQYRLLNYYDRAYRIAQTNISPTTKIVVSDAFKPYQLARALAKRQYGEQLVMDVHLYQLFVTRYQTMSFQQHMQAVQHWRDEIRAWTRQVPIMIGEWSAALPATAYAGAHSELQYAERYYDAQQRLFEEARVWAECYWTYKAPGCGVWSLRDQPSFRI